MRKLFFLSAIISMTSLVNAADNDQPQPQQGAPAPQQVEQPQQQPQQDDRPPLSRAWADIKPDVQQVGSDLAQAKNEVVETGRKSWKKVSSLWKK